jgi:molecular chaperone DnaJ
VDLYALLGVGRAASAGEIERAYRRLARRYHPGINPGDRAAAEMFRRVQHAFDVLADGERRRDYDRGDAAPPPLAADPALAFEGFDFSFTADGPMAATFTELFSDVFQDVAREATTPTRGGDLEMTVELPFRDAVLGSRFPVSVTRQERCTSCHGDGRVPRPAMTCPECEGQGSRRWARGHMVFTRACEQCDGAGRLTTQPCRACGGAGIQARSEVVTVDTPPGLPDGARLAIPGRGNAGARGGPGGDLYLTVRVLPHAHFLREGRHLHLKMPLAVHEAALGARIEVPTLDDVVVLKVPPGTPSGRRFRVVGAGVPAPAGQDPAGAGDLLIDVEIVLPPIRDERSRQLLKEFGERNPGNVREHLFGGAGRAAAARK